VPLPGLETPRMPTRAAARSVRPDLPRTHPGHMAALPPNPDAAVPRAVPVSPLFGPLRRSMSPLAVTSHPLLTLGIPPGACDCGGNGSLTAKVGGSACLSNRRFGLGPGLRVRHEGLAFVFSGRRMNPGCPATAVTPALSASASARVVLSPPARGQPVIEPGGGG